MAFNKRFCLVKPNVCAIPSELLKDTVSFIGFVKVIVAVVVRGLTNPSTAMPENFLKPTVLRTVWCVISKMPFSNHASGISSIWKNICNCLLITMEHCTTTARSVCPGTSRISTSHECSTGWSTVMANMKICEPKRFLIQAVNARSFYDWIAMTRYVAVSLVISHDYNDIWMRGLCNCLYWSCSTHQSKQKAR